MTHRTLLDDRRAGMAARYAGAVVIVLGAVAVRWLLAPALQDRHPYVTVVIATVLSLWCAGLGPAIAAFALSFAASHALFGLAPGSYAAGVYGQAAHVGTIVAETLGLGWLVWSQQRAKTTLAAEVRAALLQKQQLADEIADRRRVEATPRGVRPQDATGRCTYANEQWCAMTGYSLDETLGYEWSRTVHPDDLLATMSRWEVSVREQRPYSNQLRLVRKDGGIRHVTASALPIHDDGRVSGFIGVVIDTTQQREAEEHLRGKDLQLRSIVDNASAVVFLKDAAGRYLLVNRRFYEGFHYHGSDVIGKTDADWFPPDVARRLVEADAKVWETRRPLAVEESAPTDDGTHTFMTVKFPVTDDSGRMTALGGISTDITELKRTQDSLERTQKLLRNLIDIQERERQFLCNEFHDGLIQYAVGSKMMLESCRDEQAGRLPDAVARTLDDVVGCLGRGIEDGRRVILGIRPALLDDLGLAAAVEDLADAFTTPGLEVTTAIGPDLGPLPKDLQTGVYRIVQESLNNARKHSGARHVHVELQRADGAVLATVEDDGCGFEVAAARQRGFGLLGMHERVQLAGGDFAVESTAGAGTRITVRLPIPRLE